MDLELLEKRKDDDGIESLMTLNLGPQHPSTHGVLRVILELDGEKVVKATPDIGYLHTGIEKTIENKTYTQAITLTDRMDYMAPMSNNLAFCLATEKLLDLEIPDRAQVVRVIMTELTRLNSHLVWIGTHAIDIGAMSMLLYAFREREMILGIYELVSGQRMMSSYFRVGGLAEDIPPDFESRVREVLHVLPSRIDDYESLLTENPIWNKRTRGIGAVDVDTALDLGLTGPSLRAAGMAYDCRKASPYTGYDRYDFDVPTATEGDVYARYQVRVQEMRESLRIIEQAVGDIPGGDFMVRKRGVTPPPKAAVVTEMEALIHHFKWVSEGFRVPAGEAYVPIESPKGEMGFLMVSDGGVQPYRAKCRPPCFVNLSALPTLIEGRMVADVVAVIGSLDIVLGEIDR
jgi:NADH-quinone oxidoreductase subunit D